MVGPGGPLSIQALLEQQKAEQEATSKPKFLTKAERQKLALERREQDIKEQKDKEERSTQERDVLEKQANELRYQGQAYSGPGRGALDRPRYDDRDRHRDKRIRDEPSRPAYHHQQGIPTGPRADRLRNGGPPSGPSSAGPASGSATPSAPSGPSFSAPGNAQASTSTPSLPSMTEDDLSAIRSRYLGVDKKKRKVRKMSDRKFIFDWDEQEDTGDGAETSTPAVRAGVMFGRGHLAGMDDGAHGGRGQDEKHADPMERRQAARHTVDERHWTEKALPEMKDRDWRIFREDFSIAARGGHIPLPLRSWQESIIPVPILDIIAKIGYEEPSPIQRQAIPIGLQYRDLIGVAETGSGKTAAFVIPMLVYIGKLPPLTDDNRHLGPYALILAPTRELAQQIESEARKFAAPLGFKTVSIVGGRAVEEQAFNLREGAEIVIATPGRLKDVLDRHVLVLSQCTYIVMDEADRMVNLGFEADLNYILDACPTEFLKPEDESADVDTDGKNAKTRVTTLFSATMPPAVERLARKYLRRPATITIGEAGRAVDTVEQRVEFVHGDEKKKQRMLEILNTGGFEAPIIVFVNQKKTADMVARDIQRAGWSATTLHSGKNQEQREAALADLRSGKAAILVATDLAGRGIDVQDVSLVINYQMANTIEAYVHRIGRTGRAGKQGVAITFLTNDDDEVMYDLKQEISKSPVSKVPPELAKHEAAQQKVTREMKRKRDAEDQG
ncbi:Pre-mRNA-splicing ATP-dependent RNA helicase PRP28 [Dacryopinax primogenitus]|uniref:RNA helicase n=1 Tax=Dacryopinax primogenitus (strain DJM 731) TaxID=1858805 RepID=M5GGF9_DACPD|nr:Pre-mRNA-splicing ATP-dependent RNA helicase PRP28 [Dacryopinax primogenitus]EJU05418.1 Pre-mRNA-splicing ATP-dependent RNA helicase PRP28 [Dacryopinax primogenitus]